LLWHIRQVSAPFGVYSAGAPAVCGVDVAGTRALLQASAASSGMKGLVMLRATLRPVVS
jgi:hypothetical protein